VTAVKRTLVFVGLALVMGVSIYLAFDRFFTPNIPSYAMNIAAAFLGTVITIIITAVLLNAQSLSELGKEKSIGIFNAKLKIYGEFLKFLNEITKDGTIDDSEMLQLRGWALRMALVTGASASSTLGYFIDQTLVVKGFIWAALNDDQRESWFEWHRRTFDGDEAVIDEYDNYSFYSIGQIVMELKLDLGEEDVSNDEAALTNSMVINEIMSGL
jgi:hypothetical protein